ncbi:hypothetical protein [Tepidibacter thalassicus]|uniref:Uncharacterized protein n=1 Tax=Tepidibacter thalassicus DSM 15285 TaxID=1123350 RepID=A0A1M5P4Q9_9FIRM|nr:hypothetical protein [Tepidibacter thalassicus]SHG96728.1 hypothetical protein SAMN02744040_00385 [Tepidibacter thalassicus DSM 15285]
MNKYVIIRADIKSISNPMTKEEAISKMKEYDKQGIPSYIISQYKKNKSK